MENAQNDYSLNEVEFAIFCIENIAVLLKKDAVTIYDALRNSGILYQYVFQCYDVLHTQGKEYIVNDIIELMKKKGVEL